MSTLESINSADFAVLSQEESEMVLGGLAAAADYTNTGSKTWDIDGKLTDVPEAVTDPENAE